MTVKGRWRGLMQKDRLVVEDAMKCQRRGKCGRHLGPRVRKVHAVHWRCRWGRNHGLKGRQFNFTLCLHLHLSAIHSTASGTLLTPDQVRMQLQLILIIVIWRGPVVLILITVTTRRHTLLSKPLDVRNIDVHHLLLWSSTVQMTCDRIA